MVLSILPHLYYCLDILYKRGHLRWKLGKFARIDFMGVRTRVFDHFEEQTPFRRNDPDSWRKVGDPFTRRVRVKIFVFSFKLSKFQF